MTTCRPSGQALGLDGFSRRRMLGWLGLGLAGCGGGSGGGSDAVGPTLRLASGGNSFFTRRVGAETVSDRGVSAWRDERSVLSHYVNLRQAGPLRLGLSGQASPCRLRVSLAGQSREIELRAGTHHALGEFMVTQPGYLRIDLQGLSRAGAGYPELEALELAGAATQGARFADDAASFYWSRRGPSVHMRYGVPSRCEYLISELLIPPDQDAVGSFFMANGCSAGYFGIQVHDNERWVLFSIWDAPQGRVSLAAKGQSVVAREFGGEGTGGQSYLVYPWRAARRYRFITRVRPEAQGSTLYSAWFDAPQEGHRQFIASWRRPHTQTWLSDAHSFCENFLDHRGHQERRMSIGSLWAVSAEGQWHELTQGRFTVDATGRRQQRLDFSGGLDDDTGRFLLRNGGFFDTTVAPDQFFTRNASGLRPGIDLSTLPD